MPHNFHAVWHTHDHNTIQKGDICPSSRVRWRIEHLTWNANFTSTSYSITIWTYRYMSNLQVNTWRSNHSPSLLHAQLCHAINVIHFQFGRQIRHLGILLMFRSEYWVCGCLRNCCDDATALCVVISLSAIQYNESISRPAWVHYTEPRLQIESLFIQITIIAWSKKKST